MTSQTEIWFDSIDEVERAFDESGFTWMKPKELAFFNSMVLKDVYGGRVFVSSERMEPEDEPCYHVRLISVSDSAKDWSIDAIGERLHGCSAGEARTAAAILGEVTGMLPVQLEYGQDVALAEWLCHFVDVGMSGSTDGWNFSRERGFWKE